MKTATQLLIAAFVSTLISAFKAPSVALADEDHEGFISKFGWYRWTEEDPGFAEPAIYLELRDAGGTRIDLCREPGPGETFDPYRPVYKIPNSHFDLPAHDDKLGNSDAGPMISAILVAFRFGRRVKVTTSEHLTGLGYCQIERIEVLP